MIAIGIGCRRGIAKECFVELIERALASVEDRNEMTELFSIEDKRDDVGLLAAAAALHLSIHFLPHAALRDVEDGIATPSLKAEEIMGVASVSEAAALAGAGRDAVLIMPRIAEQGVTCAVARGGGR